VEEEATAKKILRQMEMIGDSTQGIYLLDRDLTTRIFTEGSPIDPAAYNLVN